MSLSGKIKSLILLSLFHEKIHRNVNKIELEIGYFVNKEYLNSFHFMEINEMIIKNEKIKEKINNIKIDEISEKNKNSFIKDLDHNDYNTLKNYDNDISKIKKNLPYEAEKEEIKLYELEKASVYSDFYIIFKRNKIHECFEKNFGIKFSDLDIYFGTFNGKDIILDYQNFIIYLLSQNKEKMTYNIEYILVPKEKILTFFNQLSEVVTFGYNNYFNNHFLFNEDYGNKDYISSIFVDDKIIGNCYKYSSDIKNYNKLNDYTKYLEYEALTNILSLYSYNIQIRKKTTSMILFKKYYIVNSKFLNEIKSESNFSEIYNCLEKNINNIYFDENTNKKNLYFMIKNLPIDLLEGFSDKKLNNEYKVDDIEPLQDEIYYNGKEPLLIYDNFEIIDEKILNKFVKNYKNDKIFVECILNEGKIIINLPEKLNKKYFVSLIGYIQDGDFNNFVLEYILIFKDEKYRRTHIYNINFYFNDYLNSLKFDKNCYKYKEKDIIIAKYNNGKIVDRYESQVINYDDIEDNNENNNIINKSNKIKDNFESCPNKGLSNIGATCYMNATLQCFCHIAKFVEYFKYDPQIKEIISDNKDNLSASFKILIDELWPDNFNSSLPNNKKDYAPNEFKNKISKMNPIFEGIAANDAKDLVNFIIMTLHLELNKTIENNEIINYGNIDQTNKKAIFDIYNEEVISKNNSIISKLFYATNCNTTKCSKCFMQIYNFQTYFFIVFPLEEVRKFKEDLINQQNQNFQYNIMNNFQNQFNSFNCNPQFQNNNYIMNQPYQNYNYNYPNNLQNFNIYYNTMNQQYQNNSNNINQLYQNYNFYPNNPQIYNNNNYIIYQQNQNNNIANNQNYQSNNINNKNEVCLLDCFDYDRKQNFMNGQNAMYCNGCKAICDCIVSTNLVTGPEILILLLNRGNGKEFDIKIFFDEYLDLTKYIENGCKYKLMGVISHIGENGMGGHFIAYCKDPITKQWYKYNDSLVSKVENFKKEVIDFAMPYLLFYEKINNE